MIKKKLLASLAVTTILMGSFTPTLNSVALQPDTVKASAASDFGERFLSDLFTSMGDFFKEDGKGGMHRPFNFLRMGGDVFPAFEMIMSFFPDGDSDPYLDKLNELDSKLELFEQNITALLGEVNQGQEATAYKNNIDKVLVHLRELKYDDADPTGNAKGSLIDITKFAQNEPGAVLPIHATDANLQGLYSTGGTPTYKRGDYSTIIIGDRNSAYYTKFMHFANDISQKDEVNIENNNICAIYDKYLGMKEEFNTNTFKMRHDFYQELDDVVSTSFVTISEAIQYDLTKNLNYKKWLENDGVDFIDHNTYASYLKTVEENINNDSKKLDPNAGAGTSVVAAIHAAEAVLQGADQKLKNEESDYEHENKIYSYKLKKNLNANLLSAQATSLILTKVSYSVDAEEKSSFPALTAPQKKAVDNILTTDELSSQLPARSRLNNVAFLNVLKKAGFKSDFASDEDELWTNKARRNDPKKYTNAIHDGQIDLYFNSLPVNSNVEHEVLELRSTRGKYAKKWSNAFMNHGASRLKILSNYYLDDTAKEYAMTHYPLTVGESDSNQFSSNVDQLPIADCPKMSIFDLPYNVRQKIYAYINDAKVFGGKAGVQSNMDPEYVMAINGRICLATYANALWKRKYMYLNEFPGHENFLATAGGGIAYNDGVNEVVSYEKDRTNLTH